MPLTTKITAQSDANPLEQVVGVFAKYVDAKPEYPWGLALWALHTHVYLGYPKSPRLSIVNPFRTVAKAQFWISLVQWCGTLNEL